MPKRLSLQPHLALDELQRRYRTAKDPVARSHWPLVWLLAQGLPSQQVAAVTGFTANWVRTIAQRYHLHGPTGLGEECHRNPGSAGLLAVGAGQGKPILLVCDGAGWHVSPQVQVPAGIH
jgi:hypothetical protein